MYRVLWRSSRALQRRFRFPSNAIRSHLYVSTGKLALGGPVMPNLHSVAPVWSRVISTSLHLRGMVEVKTPPFAESITEGDIKWEKGVGDAVQEDELIAEIETDKTSIPVNAPTSGVIKEVLVQDGDKVTAGVLLCKIDSEGSATALKGDTADAAPSPPPSAVTSPPPPKHHQTTDTSGPIPTVAPAVPPIPTGPMSTAPKPPPAPPLATPTATPTREAKGGRTEHRVKMSRMRLRIAERLKEAQNVNAMLTTFNEIDMSNLIEMRKLHKETFLKKHGVKLGFMSAFVKASSFALLDQPVVNAVIDGTDIVYRDYVDISVAVATPKGLVVPVLRNVQEMNFAVIEKEIHSLGVKAKDGLLSIEDMDGGTFTISNGGVFGSLYGTPIINPPQSAILGMHAIQDRPVAREGKVEIRPMMYVALTYDHRLIDGREAVTFLRKIKSAVEDPRVILMDL